MQKKLTILLAVATCSSVNAAPNPAELLKNLKEQAEKSERVKQAWCAADVGFNGVKGIGFGFLANLGTVGAYGPYAVYRTAELMDQRDHLQGLDAKQLDSRLRQELERKTALREVANRAGKIIGATLAAVLIWAGSFSAVIASINDLDDNIDALKDAK